MTTVFGAHEHSSSECRHDRHAECRLECKFCDTSCLCQCHNRGQTTPIKDDQAPKIEAKE